MVSREIRVLVSCSSEVLRQRALSSWIDASFAEATEFVQQAWIARKRSTSLDRIKLELASLWMSKYTLKMETFVSTLLVGEGVTHCPFSVNVKDYLCVDGAYVFTVFIETPSVRVGAPFEIARILNDQ